MLFHQPMTFKDRLSVFANSSKPPISEQTNGLCVRWLTLFVPAWKDNSYRTAVNRPFYSSLLSCLAFEWKWGWRWPCFDRNLYALVMLMMLFQCKLVSIYIRKALRILSKQGYLQPYFHSKARQLKWSVISCATGIPIVSCDVVVEVASDITVRTYMPAELIVWKIELLFLESVTVSSLRLWLNCYCYNNLFSLNKEVKT